MTAQAGARASSAARSTDRLGPGAAPYRLLTVHDLPSEWRSDVAEGTLRVVAEQMAVDRVVGKVVVEMPDYPWALHYYSWTRSCAFSFPAERDSALEILVVSRSEFRGLSDEAARSRATEQCLRSLLEHGHPAPLFFMYFVPASGPAGN